VSLKCTENRRINIVLNIKPFFSWSEKKVLISDIACFPAEISPISPHGEAGKLSTLNIILTVPYILNTVFFYAKNNA